MLGLAVVNTSHAELKMLVLQVAAALLLFDINCCLCQENICIYSDGNGCSNCSLSLHMKNISGIPQGDGLTVYFCSTRIFLDAAMLFEDRVNIGIMGSPGRSVECIRNRSAGILFRNVTGIKIESLVMLKCGLSLSHTTASAHTKKSSLYISNSCNIALSAVTISQSSGVGLSVLNSAGDVNIENCTFNNNEVPKESTKNYTGGGGLYIEISLNSHRCKGSTYQIAHCDFLRNTASTTAEYASSLGDDNFQQTLHQDFQNLGRGGGISITLSGVATGNTITISNSNFISNSAFWGGGLYAMFHGSADSNQLLINNANFTGNSSPHGGGGIAIGLISFADLAPSSPHKTKNNLMLVDSSYFNSNTAKFGGGITLYATESSDLSQANNSIRFSDCTWESNTAHIGAAVDLSSHIWSETKGSLPEVRFANCSFLSNSVFHITKYEKSYMHHTKGKGVFYSVGYAVEFSEETNFHFNNGSALYLVSSNAYFSKGSAVEFTRNWGFSGGAITMLGFSALNIQDNMTFLFDGNTAEDRGGAIIAVSLNKKDLVDTKACFIQYIPEEYNGTAEFVFINNSAGRFGRSIEVEGHYGHSIFASSLEPCNKQCSQNNPTEIILDCSGKFIFHDMIKYDISTLGKEIKVTEDALLPLKVVPGKLTRLPINMTDELDHEINDLYHVQVSGSKVVIDYSDAYIAERKIRFFSTPGETANVTIETTDIREIGITFGLQMEECPPGYVLIPIVFEEGEANTCLCSAATPDKQYPGIHRCNDTEFVAFLKKGYWLGYDQSDEYGNETHLLCGYCPSGYCSTNNASYTTEKEYKLPKNTSIQALNEFICGQARTGILCGVCAGNYTTYYNSRSYACREARNCQWGWLFFILAEIVPITLVFVAIMVFNIKLTTGAFNAFLYFAQVSDNLLITANGFITFPYHTYTFVRINRLIYRMFNLNFFAVGELSFCLWKSAQTLDLLIFKYVTIIYALILVFIIIAFMRFCNCRTSKSTFLSRLHWKKRSAHSTIIHGLTGFLVMCYSEGTRISLLLLTPVLLQTNSQSGNSYVKQVVFYNGEMDFFAGAHLLYALPALLFFIILGIIPPILLLSYPLCYRVFGLLKISETRFISILCKCIPLESLRPFFDSFQSSFRDNCRFFAGLYFLYRLTFLCSFAFMQNLNEFYLTAQAQLVVILTVHAIVQPYKQYWHNVVDALLFMILNIINAMTLFNYKHASEVLDYNHVIHIVSKAQTTLLYLPLVYILIYTAVILYKKEFFRRLIKKLRRKGSAPNDHRMTLCTATNADDNIDLLNSDYHHRKDDKF